MKPQVSSEQQETTHLSAPLSAQDKHAITDRACLTVSVKSGASVTAAELYELSDAAGLVCYSLWHR